MDIQNWKELQQFGEEKTLQRDNEFIQAQEDAGRKMSTRNLSDAVATRKNEAIIFWGQCLLYADLVELDQK